MRDLPGPVTGSRWPGPVALAGSGRAGTLPAGADVAAIIEYARLRAS